MFSAEDKFWMEHAISLARTAAELNEVPVGAVLVHENKILGEGYNQPIAYCDPSAHAEIVALRQGAKKLNNYRLVNTTLYSTLEPCVMCIGAIVYARIKRLVFGANDSRAGAIVSVFQIVESKKLNHQIICEGGLLAESCGRLLTDFFKERRLNKNLKTFEEM